MSVVKPRNIIIFTNIEQPGSPEKQSIRKRAQHAPTSPVSTLVHAENMKPRKR